MANCSIQDLVDEGKCFLNVPAPFVQVIQTVLLCRILQISDPMASCDIQELLDSGRCFLAIGEQERSAIQTQLLCEILQAGGGGGSSCLLCGIIDPVDVPACDCAIYYNRTTGSFWVWDSDLAAWYALIAG